MEPEPTQEQHGNSRENPAAHLAPHQFKPGQSGNPGGRPKGRSIAAILRELLDADELGGQKIPKGKRAADLLGEALLHRALKGDIRHIQEVINRTEGKVPDRLDVSSDGNTFGLILSRLNGDELDTFEALTRKALGGDRPATDPGDDRGGAVPPEPE